jgi:O-antigen ligase
LIILFCLIFLAVKFNPIWNKIEIVEKNPWHNGTVYQINLPCKNNKNEICKQKFETQPFFYEVLNNFSKSAYWETYNQAITIWKDHPFFGIGIKNYTNACKLEKYKENLRYFFCTTHPHNFYIQWLLETGVLGLLGFITLLFIWFKYFFKTISKNINPLIYAPILTLFVLFWPIMSTGSFFSNRNATMNWFIIALCLAITNLRNKKV